MANRPLRMCVKCGEAHAGSCAQRQAKPGRFVICGPPGSGKTTYVEQRRKPGDFVWDFDDARKFIFGGCELYELGEAHKQILIGMLEGAISRLANWQRAIYVIVTSHKWAKALCNRINAECVVLDVDRAECIRRVHTRNRDARYMRDVEDVIRKWEREPEHIPAERHLDRPGARERGYSKAWDKAAAAYRREHPLCVECEKQGIISTGPIVVDHIKPVKYFPELFWEPGNWQTLCVMHNNRKRVTDEVAYETGR